jgi:aryl-alcohol dehydrogenase-like predicted oxidoreductase
MISKLGIGTSQFSDNGIYHKKLVSNNETIKIIKNLKKINFVDVAPSYGNAEKLIGKYLKKNRNIKIITKIDKFKSKNIFKIIKNFKEDFEKSLKNLKVSKIHSVLFHSEEDLSHPKINLLINVLIELKKKGKIENFGLSSYNISTLEKNVNKFQLSAVEIPLNCFTISKKNCEILKRLKKNSNAEIYARSIFMRGYALKDINFKGKFSVLKKKLNIIDEYVRYKKFTRYDFLLSSIYNLRFIDTCLIGCSSMEELKRLEKFKPTKINKNIIKKILISNKFVVNPLNWKYEK